MTIVIIQKKAVEATTMPSAEPPIPPEIVGLIDQVGAMQEEAEATAKKIKALHSQLQPYADKVKQLTELVSKCAEQSGIDPDREFTALTDDFVLQVGCRVAVNGEKTGVWAQVLPLLMRISRID